MTTVLSLKEEETVVIFYPLEKGLRLHGQGTPYFVP